jgi:hypothetical protein
MSRAQPKSSPTDQYARRIAVAIGKGQPPPFSDDLDRHCESSPRAIFAAFAGAARYMPPAGEDETLAIGYLFLLQRLLEHLRYRTDSGYADAAKLIADFQADVAARVEAGHVDGGSVESFWRLFKNSIKSTHIHVSTKYMDRYLREFTFRSNHRQMTNAMFDLLIAAV